MLEKHEKFFTAIKIKCFAENCAFRMHLKIDTIISNAKYESVTKKWESFSNDDILSFQSNYLKENGLELKAEEDIGPAFYVKSPESSLSSVDIRTDIVTDEVYLDEYKDRLRSFYLLARS